LGKFASDVEKLLVISLAKRHLKDGPKGYNMLHLPLAVRTRANESLRQKPLSSKKP